MIQFASFLSRRSLGRVALRVALAGVTSLGLSAQTAVANDSTGGDPFKSMQWPELKKEYFGSAKTEFDARVKVLGPKFAEDPMNVPISVNVDGLRDVKQIVVIVDRNPIRKVLEYFPERSSPAVSFRFKLEQASPVRAAALTADGVWHVGGAWVDSTGGGCTVSGATRKDGSWAKTLGNTQAKVFNDVPTASAQPSDHSAQQSTAPQIHQTPSVKDAIASRIRVRVMHPMDTGLVSGIPAFYLNKLAVQDANGKILLRMNTFEPVSENPVFSFDFPDHVRGTLSIVGTDNNGNKIHSKLN